MIEQNLRFAMFGRVSMEQQLKGQSLETQISDMREDVQKLGGIVVREYAGQEHGTAGFEKRNLEQLMMDARAGQFNCLIVWHVDRWSRDNNKSSTYLEELKELGIRFFVRTQEYNLYDPSAFMFISLNVVIGAYHSMEQSRKSTINRINRAKSGAPVCTLPFGRTYNKNTKEWGIDPEKYAIINKVAQLYLENDISWKILGKQFGMNPANLRTTICERSGDIWIQHFVSKRNGIKEEIPTKVPRLLPQEIIEAIRIKSGDKKTWDRSNGSVNEYLLGRLVFDAKKDLTLNGTVNTRGQRYYKIRAEEKPCYNVNADVLEKAVLETLYEALGCTESLQKAVFDAHPMGKVADKFKQDIEDKQKELSQIEQNIENYLTAIGNSADVAGFMERIKPKLIELETRSKSLKDDISNLNYKLTSLPDPAEIEALRDKWSGLLDVQKRGYLSSGVALENLPFDVQRKIIKLFFGGRDATGKRYGIYVEDLGGKPRQFRYEAYGRLGTISGSLTARIKQGTGYANVLREDSVLAEKMGKLILQADPTILSGEIGDTGRGEVASVPTTLCGPHHGGADH